MLIIKIASYYNSSRAFQILREELELKPNSKSRECRARTLSDRTSPHIGI